jgi:diadenosine tetraphosphatase ApaH/serine/threonine PP2A family protein phosphatase
MDRNVVAVRGNHDEAIAGPTVPTTFHPDAADALRWQRDRLSVWHLDWLASLPRARDVDRFITLVHGTPPDDIHRYWRGGADEIDPLMDQVATPHCAVAHTHRPALYLGRPAGRRRVRWSETPLDDAGASVSWGEKDRLLVNPGSVGQPRDGRASASFAILEPEARCARIRRVDYDWKATSRKMKRAGFPRPMRRRLRLGR